MSFSIDYDADDAIEQTERDIALFGSLLVGREAFQKLGEFLVSKINSEYQNEQHVVSGEMISKTHVIAVGEDFVIVGNPTIQAAVLEDGRIEVRPRNAKALHWVDKHTGEDVFAMRSGPVEATHIMEKAIKEGIDEYIKKVFAEIDRQG